jgi:hypothetical protein
LGGSDGRGGGGVIAAPCCRVALAKLRARLFEGNGSIEAEAPTYSAHTLCMSEEMHFFVVLIAGRELTWYFFWMLESAHTLCVAKEMHFIIASVASWELMCSLCWVLEPTFVAQVTASSLPVPADRHVSVFLV